MPLLNPQARIKSCFAAWCLIQAVFFLPRDWPVPERIYRYSAPCGTITVFQKGRAALLDGACSDRFQKFSRTELVPGLRENGVAVISKIVLTGHDSDDTAALEELQKNFQVCAVEYPPGNVQGLRKTFGRIGRNVRLIAARVPD